MTDNNQQIDEKGKLVLSIQSRGETMEERMAEIGE
jgi:hypothetical protein